MDRGAEGREGLAGGPDPEPRVDCHFPRPQPCAALVGASHTSPTQVRRWIDRFVGAYNETATPFEWQKRQVDQVNLSHYYADLRN